MASSNGTVNQLLTPVSFTLLLCSWQGAEKWKQILFVSWWCSATLRKGLGGGRIEANRKSWGNNGEERRWQPENKSGLGVEKARTNNEEKKGKVVKMNGVGGQKKENTCIYLFDFLKWQLETVSPARQGLQNIFYTLCALENSYSVYTPSFYYMTLHLDTLCQYQPWFRKCSVWP